MNGIAIEAEYDQTIAEINRLLRKGEAKLSPEEYDAPQNLDR
jgi:hypothetical protein